MLAFFAVSLWDATQHTFLGQIFPLGVAIVGLVFAVILLIHLWRGHEDHPAFYDYEVVGDHVRQEGKGWIWTGPAWLGGLVAATALVGFYASMIGFFVAFLRLRTGASWQTTLLMTAGAAVFVLVLAWMLSLNFPRGLAQDMLDLPWPFR